VTRTIERPWQVYALTMLWAIKAAEEFFRGVLGTGFYIAAQMDRGELAGYGLQLAIQSVLFSFALTVGSLYVMVALWLGKAAARPWGVGLAALGELTVLVYLLTRPPEFGGDTNLVRTVVIATIVNGGITAFLLFDAKLATFLGSTRLTGWWAPKR
jgi:hypothetical protein